MMLNGNPLLKRLSIPDLFGGCATQLQVITLWQPWATWIMRGWKLIETRTHNKFGCLIGKTIGIHAGLRVDDSLAVIANPYLTREQICESPDEVVQGYLLGTAFVRGFRLLNERDSRAALIDCGSVQRWGLFLDNMQRLPQPIKMSGKQGIWSVAQPPL
jgi:hypothetical protein